MSRHAVIAEFLHDNPRSNGSVMLPGSWIGIHAGQRFVWNTESIT